MHHLWSTEVTCLIPAFTRRICLLRTQKVAHKMILSANREATIARAINDRWPLSITISLNGIVFRLYYGKTYDVQ